MCVFIWSAALSFIQFLMGKLIYAKLIWWTCAQPTRARLTFDFWRELTVLKVLLFKFVVFFVHFVFSQHKFVVFKVLLLSIHWKCSGKWLFLLFCMSAPTLAALEHVHVGCQCTQAGEVLNRGTHCLCVASYGFDTPTKKTFLSWVVANGQCRSLPLNVELT